MRVEANGIRFVDHECDDITAEVDADGFVLIVQNSDSVMIALDDVKQFATELLSWAKKAAA